jgi:hypothetical protein
VSRRVRTLMGKFFPPKGVLARFADKERVHLFRGAKLVSVPQIATDAAELLFSARGCQRRA